MTRPLALAPDHCSEAAPPHGVPPGHVGPAVLPDSGRRIWWTGRVAIGLRWEPRAIDSPVPHSQLWVQDLLLDNQVRKAA